MYESKLFSSKDIKFIIQNYSKIETEDFKKIDDLLKKEETVIAEIHKKYDEQENKKYAEAHEVLLEDTKHEKMRIIKKLEEVEELQNWKHTDIDFDNI